jgi:hypothetical protein
MSGFGLRDAGTVICGPRGVPGPGMLICGSFRLPGHGTLICGPRPGSVPGALARRTWPGTPNRPQITVPWPRPKRQVDAAGKAPKSGPGEAPKVPTPTVKDPKLRNLINDLYKGTKNPKRVGTGTTADAVRHELGTGQPTNGRWHLTKARESARGLENWLKRNPKADPHDRSVARNLLKDLRAALGGK